jgi:AcrR family transcriptional regulator
MSTEEQILAAAAEILERDGVAALTTRAVCQAAGVTAPTLYHHFGDKDGLSRALVARGVTDFLMHKRSNRETADPLADLRRGWDGWLAFANERPNLFRLMVDHSSGDPSASREAYQIMRSTVERLAQARRLTTDVETAARTIWAASNGVLMLFMQGQSQKDIKISSDLLFDGLVAKLLK